MNNTGKTLTVFLIVIAILSVSLATIALFFFAKEVEERRSLEENVNFLKVKEATLRGENKEAKQHIFLLEEKGKESEERIESLMEDLDLEVGLREEIKKENRQLKESLAAETRAKGELTRKLSGDISKSEKKIVSLQKELKATVERNKNLDSQRQMLQAQYQKVKDQLKGMNIVPVTEVPQIEPPAQEEYVYSPAPENVDLEKIVIAPLAAEGKGSIITIDTDAEFIIVDLGKQDGVAKNTVLSIYRGDNYLGDVKVSRVLPQMSAADFIPPLTSQGVRKEDTVVVKK
jgi:hypothetical protein